MFLLIGEIKNIVKGGDQHGLGKPFCLSQLQFVRHKMTSLD